MAYKFTETMHPKPSTIRTRLFEKAEHGQELSREEKDRLADYCYGVFGSGFSGMKLGGWCWSVSRHLQEYIVEQHGNLQSYFAPDKTSLRRALHGTITRIIQVTEKKRGAF